MSAPDSSAVVFPEPSAWGALPAMRVFAEGGTLLDAEGNAVSVHSCSTPNNLTVLAHLFRELRPKVTLEVGLAFGASASLFLSLHRLSGSEAGRCHHAIDCLQHSLWKGCGLRHIRDSGLEPWFRFHDRASALALPDIQESGVRAGLIYLDGSHLFEDVFVDFYHSHRLLDVGGVMAFDDSSHSHVMKVIRFIRTNLQREYEELNPYAVTAPRWPRVKQLAARISGRQQLTLFKKREEWERPQSAVLRPF
jgi:hypothetical protein